MDRFIVGWGRFIVRFRWPVLLSTLAVVGALGAGGQHVYFENNYRYFFADGNPELEAFEALQRVYRKSDSVIFVVESEDGAFSKGTMAAVGELTEKAWLLPFVTRVDSVTNFQHTVAEEDDLIVADLVESPKSATAEALAAARVIAVNEPLLRDRLVSPDGKVTAVNAVVELPADDPLGNQVAVDAARELASAIEAAHPGVRVRLTGMVMLNGSFFEASMQDMGTLVPIMYGVLLLVLAIFLRSVMGTLATLLVIGMSAMGAMGFAGWMGIPITPPSAIAPTVIMTLAVADSVHILIAWLQLMGRGMERREAVVESLRLNFIPVFLTSLTTAIGFLSMNFSDVQPFHDLGNITGFGVLVAFTLAVVFLPALMAIMPVKVRAVSETNSAWSDRLADWVIAQRRGILMGTGAIVLTAMAMLPRNELNDQFVEYFDESFAFRTDSDFTTENLTGVYQIELSVASGESGGISDPEYLARLDEFTDWYSAQTGVWHVNSLTTTLKRLNRSMHGDDDGWYRLPESREMAAQYLLLYEMSLPYGLDLNDQLDVDKSATRVVVTTRNLSSNEFLALAAAGQEWLKTNGLEPMKATTPASTALMFAKMSGRNTESMLFGTGSAFLLISLILMVALRSFRMGALSLIPNLVPAVVAFGAWGLLVGQINLGLSIVVAVSLGIVVDDTVHFMSKYLRARREKGLTAEEAVRYTLASVGPALIVTSLVLVAGFLVLSASPFAMNGSMGQLTAVTLLIALIADLTFLPALLLWLDREETTIQSKDSLMKPALNKVALVFAIVAGASLAAPSNAVAAGPDAAAVDGLKIAKEADRRDNGFGDSTANMRMVLKNRHGQSSERAMRVKTLEVPGDGDKSLVVFDKPRDVSGTALLSFSHGTEPDDQWLYLPALSRVKRISTNNKSGPFMGSEFAYEDISSQEVGKYTYRVLRKETLDKKPCHVVERIPTDSKSGYSKQIAWYDTAEYRVLKTEFYDRKGSLLKTLKASGFKKYMGKYWRPSRLNMVNHQNGKSTVLEWTDYAFRTGVSAGQFTRSSLKRAR